MGETLRERLLGDCASRCGGPKWKGSHCARCVWRMEGARIALESLPCRCGGPTLFFEDAPITCDRCQCLAELEGK